MKKGLYVVYDKSANDVSSIFEAKTLHVANRQFYLMVKDSPFVDEYELWRVGFMEIITHPQKEAKITTKVSDLFEVVALGNEVVSDYNKKANNLQIIEGGNEAV